jgi:hypothetical protein
LSIINYKLLFIEAVPKTEVSEQLPWIALFYELWYISTYWHAGDFAG